MRLIDADSLLREVGNYSLEVACNKSDGRLETMTKVTQAVQDHAAECIDDAPTIDPETFPIVRRLREELARVTAERDAAVEQLSELECCEFCEYTGCIPRGGVGKCEWRWCGPRKEK